MQEKITGVVLDIPTVIQEAKAKRQPFEWQYKTCGITFDATNLTDAERFLITNECTVLDDPVPTLANIVPSYYKNQRFVPAPEWISVEERLPEEDQVVLGWDGIHFYESRLMQHEKDLNSPYELSFYIQDSNSGFMMPPILPITHWMEAPAPPKDCSNT